MAWTRQWTITVDGTNLNDHAKFVTMVPELQNVQQRRMITAEIDGDWPVFIRSQPQEGSYTFLIAFKAAIWSDTVWDQRMDEIMDLFAPDATHTFTAQVRGMPTAKSTTIVVEAITPDYRTRTCVVNAFAPKPVLE